MYGKGAAGTHESDVQYLKEEYEKVDDRLDYQDDEDTDTPNPLGVSDVDPGVRALLLNQT